jgi:5'-nucleotidase
VSDSPGKPLVVAISSRALLDLKAEDKVYREEGVEAFIQYQRSNEEVLIPKGVAFPFVKALTDLNGIFGKEKEPAIRLVIVSRNHPDCGLRIVRSLEEYGLRIPQAAFTGGQPVINELRMFEVDLFLSYEAKDITDAIEAGLSAAQIFGGPCEVVNPDGVPLLAFDGDSTLFSDEGDQAYRDQGMPGFEQLEMSKLGIPLEKGPMYRFVNALAQLQARSPIENPPFRIALVTARNFQYMRRPIQTLRAWGIRLDKAYLIGTMKKSDVLRGLHAVIFFDDSDKHCFDVSPHAPTARVLWKSQDAPVVLGSPGVLRMEQFDAVCKIFLRKDFSKHREALHDGFSAWIVDLPEEAFNEKLAELKRSIEGTPKGSLVKERRAAGDENSQFQKLVSFLENLRYE